MTLEINGLNNHWPKLVHFAYKRRWGGWKKHTVSVGNVHELKIIKDTIEGYGKAAKMIRIEG